MRKQRKIGFALLTAAMIFGLMGCGNSSKNEPVQTAAQKEVQTTAAAAETAAEAASEVFVETAWPERAVSIIVGANPGGGQDSVARLYAKYMTEATGKAFNVVNVSGGSGSIASTQVKDSAPDGYNMLSTHEAILSNHASQITDYDVDAFEFVGIGVASHSMTLVCNGKHFKNMDELKAYASENPGKVVAATEWGGTTHQALLALEQGLGIEISIVDGGSVGERISGIVGEIYDMTVTPMGNVSDYIKNESMIPILMFNDYEYENYKGIPISSDYSVDYVFDKFFGLFFPKGTDPSIVLKCRSLLKEMTEKKEFAEDVEKLDFVVDYMDEVSAFEPMKEKLTSYSEKYPIE